MTRRNPRIRRRGYGQAFKVLERLPGESYGSTFADVDSRREALAVARERAEHSPVGTFLTIRHSPIESRDIPGVQERSLHVFEVTGIGELEEVGGQYSQKEKTRRKLQRLGKKIAEEFPEVAEGLRYARPGGERIRSQVELFETAETLRPGLLSELMEEEDLEGAYTLQTYAGRPKSWRSF